MNAALFRAAALEPVGSFESAHQGHPDFRGPKGIFATLNAEETHGAIRLPAPMADALAQERPDMTRVVWQSGSWRWIQIELESYDAGDVRELLTIAWAARNGSGKLNP